MEKSAVYYSMLLLVLAGDEHGRSSCCLLAGLAWRLQQEHIRQYLCIKTCREHYSHRTSFGSRHKLRKYVWINHSLSFWSVHWLLGQPRALGAALRPGAFFFSMELPQDADKTAPGLLCAVPNLGLAPQSRNHDLCLPANSSVLTCSALSKSLFVFPWGMI